MKSGRSAKFALTLLLTGCDAKPVASSPPPIEPLAAFKKVFPIFKQSFDDSLKKSQSGVKVESFGWTFDVKKTDSLVRPFRAEALGLKEIDMSVFSPGFKAVHKVTVEFQFEEDKWKVAKHQIKFYDVRNPPGENPDVTERAEPPGMKDGEYIDRAVAAGDNAILQIQ